MNRKRPGDKEKKPIQGPGSFGLLPMLQQYADQSGSGNQEPPLLTDIELNLLNTEVIRNVRFENKIGFGCQGTVFRVEAQYKIKPLSIWHTGPLACKVIRIPNNTPACVQKSTREIFILKILRHEHICNMVEYVPLPDSKKYTLFLELCHGDLGNLLKDGKQAAGLLTNQEYRFSEQLSQHWFRHIVRGLAYIHEKGVTHNDIKKANILFRFSGNAEDFDTKFLSAIFKLGDFGLSELGNPKLGTNEANVCMVSQLSDIEKLLKLLYNTGVFGGVGKWNRFIENCRTGIWTGNPNDVYKWNELSADMKDLMGKMSKTHHGLLAAEILNHRWVNEYSDHELD